MTKLTADEQIDVIVQMMVSREWKGMVSRRELAKKWGCHERTVGDRADQASAFVRRQGGPLDDWVAGKIAELEGIVEEAMGSGHEQAAVNAIKLMMDAKGALNHVKKTQELPADGAGLKDLVKAILGDDRVKAEVLEQLKGETKEGLH